MFPGHLLKIKRNDEGLEGTVSTSFCFCFLLTTISRKRASTKPLKTSSSAYTDLTFPLSWAPCSVLERVRWSAGALVLRRPPNTGGDWGRSESEDECRPGQKSGGGHQPSPVPRGVLGAASRRSVRLPGAPAGRTSRSPTPGGRQGSPPNMLRRRPHHHRPLPIATQTASRGICPRPRGHQVLGDRALQARGASKASRLSNKHAGCPVQFEFQINNKYNSTRGASIPCSAFVFVVSTRYLASLGGAPVCFCLGSDTPVQHRFPLQILR